MRRTRLLERGYLRHPYAFGLSQNLRETPTENQAMTIRQQQKAQSEREFEVLVVFRAVHDGALGNVWQTTIVDRVAERLDDRNDPQVQALVAKGVFQ